MEENRCPGCMNIKNGIVCEHCGFDERRQNAPHQLQIGTALQDRYLVGRALGQGGFGITYLGWNRYLDKKVAIKEYYPSAFVDRNATHDTTVVCRTEQMEGFFTENRKRFLREAKTLAKLEEVPQIVSILDFFEANHTAYIVMEYLQGSDLRDYIQKQGGRLSPTQTLNIMRPVMAALVKVHEAGLVHRDISPDNIMLQYDGSVKLMDFGAVRSVNNAAVDKELTQATQAIVKHGFAPIEQYSARGSIGPWSDEYALCATMYYCMTGRVPMNATDRIEEESEINWDEIQGLTAQQKEILRKGTAIRAKDRYHDIRQLMDALFAPPVQKPVPQPPVQKPVPQPQPPVPQPPVSQPVSVPEPPAREAAKPRKGGKKGIFVLLGALVLAAVVLLAIPNGMKEKDGRKYYYRWGRPVTGWQEIDGNTYYFEDDGKAAVAWQTFDGDTYYFGWDGVMVTGWQTLSGTKYYFDLDGTAVTGIFEIDGKKYFFGQSGKMMANCWAQGEDGRRSYFGADGVMATGWVDVFPYRYYFGKEGKAMTGVQKIDGSRYFFDSEGRMQYGWQEIDGRKYYFESDGKAAIGWRDIDGERYYFGALGIMVTEWVEIDGITYYFRSDGRLIR